MNSARFVNDAGQCHIVHYRICPETGAKHLSSEVVESRSSNFLFDDLTSRLAAGDIRFRLFGQIAETQAPVDDATRPWPGDRSLTELDTLVTTAELEDSRVVERGLVLDPARLANGIELPSDPLPIARSAIYALAYRRRNTDALEVRCA